MESGFGLGDKQLATFHKYESAYRRAYESAWKKLKALQKERKAADQPLPAEPPQEKIQNEAKIATAAPIVLWNLLRWEQARQ